jgi:hypothetical protein
VAYLGRCFSGLVIAKRDDLGAGLQALRGGIEQAGDARFLPRFPLLLGELAACLGQVGQMAPGLAIVEDTLARCGKALPRRVRRTVSKQARSGAARPTARFDPPHKWPTVLVRIRVGCICVLSF